MLEDRWNFLLMTLLCKNTPYSVPSRLVFPFFLEKTNSTSNGVLENEIVTCNYALCLLSLWPRIQLSRLR